MLPEKVFEAHFPKGVSVDYHSPSATLHVLQAGELWQKTLPEGFALHFCPVVKGVTNTQCHAWAGGFSRYLSKRLRRDRRRR